MFKKQQLSSFDCYYVSAASTTENVPADKCPPCCLPCYWAAVAVRDPPWSTLVSGIKIATLKKAKQSGEVLLASDMLYNTGWIFRDILFEIWSEWDCSKLYNLLKDFAGHRTGLKTICYLSSENLWAWGLTYVIKYKIDKFSQELLVSFHYKWLHCKQIWKKTFLVRKHLQYFVNYV